MSLLKIITPINLEEEEIKFWSSPTYQPSFKYDWDETEPAQKYQNLVQAIYNQDTDRITQEAEMVFEVKWNLDYVEIAESHINNRPENQPIVSGEDFKQSFTKAFDNFNLDYEVILSDKNGFFMRPQPSKKQLIISTSANYTFFPLDTEIRHEMTHIIRYENGEFNKIEKSNHHLVTEEGLATYNQDHWQGQITPAAFQHAAEYAVTDVMRKGSLREGIDYLISIGFPPKLAWQRAVRHKFGFVDTRKPGDIMKPAMYFVSSQKIGEISEEERIRLFVGKISVDELNQYHEYRGRWNKEMIKDFFYG